jgi:phytoene dehydrogenase-like protein
MAGGGRYDAVVVGAGPNGLAAAAVLARAGLAVLVLEANETVGGGARSAALTLPGYLHDVCSAIYPMAVAAPLFGELGLEAHGLAWTHPAAPLAHPLDDGPAALLERSVEATGATLGEDAAAWRRAIGLFAARADRLFPALLGPPRPPRHPLLLARFGLRAIRSARGLAESRFRGARARALFAGCAAHSVLPLEAPASAAIGLVLAVAGHAVGWPFPRGGSQRIADALAAAVRALGGEIETGRRVRSIEELPRARAILFDVTPRQLARIAGRHLPKHYLRRLARFRYGPGVFKLDWALEGPIPWRAAECARAATVHVGGTLDEIAAAEVAVARGEHPERPFVLLAQQSLFDPSRAPAARHTGWAYCHVPAGSPLDMTERIEAQVERFAPGFRDRILARSRMGPADFERHDENYVGGDITGGRNDLAQLIARPVLGLVPYATPNPRIFLCSSSTPPGGGVHGMCGYHAARAALRRAFGRA